ncbi:MAG: type II secretion system protein N [Hyphomonas sp.]
MRLFRMESPLPGQFGLMGRRSVEAGLALVTGLMLARFVWLVAEPGLVQPERPLTPVMLAGNSSHAELAGSDPFAAPSHSRTDYDTATPTTLNLRLTGLRWAGDDAAAGSAIIVLPDGNQKLVSPGDRILDGAVLDTVAADRIFLRSNGRLEELRLNPRGGSFSSQQPSVDLQSPPAETPAAPARQATPAQLASDIVLHPDLRNGAVTGYRLSPRGNGYFEQAGLEPGDLVLRVNGQSVEGLGPDALQSAVLASDTISLDVVRSGAIVRLRISADAGLSQ